MGFQSRRVRVPANLGLYLDSFWMPQKVLKVGVKPTVMLLALEPSND